MSRVNPACQNKTITKFAAFSHKYNRSPTRTGRVHKAYRLPSFITCIGIQVIIAELRPTKRPSGAKNFASSRENLVVTWAHHAPYHDHIVDSGDVMLIEVTCFVKLNAEQVFVFYRIAGLNKIKLMRNKKNTRKRCLFHLHVVR